MGAAEAIWAGTFSGLRQGLARADKLEEEGKLLNARIVRASVWYSYRYLPFAFHRATSIAQSMHGHTFDAFTAEQCDVLGTILLRAGNTDRARMYFDEGLKRPKISHHLKALLYIGRAEVSATTKADKVTREFILKATSLYGSVLNDDKDTVQAMRQFSRVARRAAVVYWKLGNKEQSMRWFVRAQEMVRHPQWGSRSQRLKLSWTRFAILS